MVFELPRKVRIAPLYGGNSSKLNGSLNSAQKYTAWRSAQLFELL